MQKKTPDDDNMFKTMRTKHKRLFVSAIKFVQGQEAGVLVLLHISAVLHENLQKILMKFLMQGIEFPVIIMSNGKGGKQMKEGEIKQDVKTVEQLVDGMNLFDDDLMSMVFDGNIEAAELLLRIILKRDDITVISVVGQKEFQNPVVGGRNIRLDILAVDSAGKHYNVEVQQKPEGAHVRRARFHSSMMDSRMLKEGQEFSEIPDSYMVFITRTDIFGRGIPIYTVNRRFEEIDDWFDDGSHIVYVNGSYRGEDAIGRLMHDFHCKESKDMYYKELRAGVKHFKEEEGGREAMCEAVEKYAERYAERYADKRVSDEKIQMVKNVMKSMKWTAEQAMSAMQMSDHDRAELIKKL